MAVRVQLRRLTSTQLVQNINARRAAVRVDVCAAHCAECAPGHSVASCAGDHADAGGHTVRCAARALPGRGITAAYLLAGAAGAPVFAMGAGFAYLFGPTGGYLLSYPLAAAVAGLLGGKPTGDFTSVGRIALAMLVASAVTLLLGWAQLSVLTGDAQRAFQVGVQPFIIGDLLKVTLGALIAVRLRPRTLGLV